MPDLLLELFSEEIPARMQAQGAADLQRMMTDGLKAAGIEPGVTKAYATPRRLTLHMTGLPGRSADVAEEKKGPRVGAPEQAIAGFLKSAGLARIEDAEIHSDKKGDFYIARIARTGRPTAEIVAELVPDIVRRFPWPKSMRWGSGRLRWVRPLHSIVCLLDGQIVPFEIDGIASGNKTRGHRFLSEGAFAVRGFDDYLERLEDAHVVLDPELRQRTIVDSARSLAEAEGGSLAEDDALVAENAGLTEWPVPLMGAFDESFLDVPPEVLMTAMKAHQKCFSVRGEDGKLLNRFVLVSNLVAKDGGAAIIAGNERVIRARLSDAKFFWDQDRITLLQDRVIKLRDIIFHEKLGTQYERTKRLMALSRELSSVTGADPDEAERAAILAKADLVTGMVGEFPELQGLMGRYYALDQGEQPEVADALASHYKPVGPNDTVPSEPIAMAVALADKLDMLVGFWAIDEKPTGSKDPYALRRAALGVIRIVLENGLELPLMPIMHAHYERIAEAVARRNDERRPFNQNEEPLDLVKQFDLVGPHLMDFFVERLKVYLRDRGARHDLIDAVFALPGQDDLLLIVRRVEALEKFLTEKDGANLLAGTKRASNILRIEEKKDGRAYEGEPDQTLFESEFERHLWASIQSANLEAKVFFDEHHYSEAMETLGPLRGAVDAFFEKVNVNADDPAIRANRLKLLNQIRAATRQVADFSKIEG